MNRSDRWDKRERLRDTLEDGMDFKQTVAWIKKVLKAMMEESGFE